MAKPRLSSMLVLGVAWGRTDGVTQNRTLDRLADQLLDRFGRRQFKATWAIPELNPSIVQRIRAMPIAQEIALDAVPSTPRDRKHSFAFAAWLRDRVQEAHDIGIGLRSLAVAPTGCVPYNVVAKLGFRTVRPGRGRSHHLVQPVQPQSLRYGVWGLPVSTHWPQPNRFLQHFTQQQIAYSLRRTVQRNAVLHIVFELASMSLLGDNALRAVDRLLETAADMRDQQQLNVARLMDVDQLVRLETAARPMQSILRRAA